MSIEILPSAADVIALRIRGRLDHDEMERMIDMIERSFAEHDKTHFFVEAIDFAGFELGRIGDYASRAWPILGKLDRFGRIAIVSDQAWLRAAARLESALLPKISYEIYDSSKREHALAWVEGRERRPRPGGMRVIETDTPGVLAFEIDGKVSEEDVEALAQRFDTDGAGEGPTLVIGRISRLEGFEARALFDDDLVRMKLAALSSVKKYALVGGPAWMAGWVSFADRLAKADIRHFELSDEAAAWEWIGARPR